MYDDDIRVLLWEILKTDCCFIIQSLSAASPIQGGGLLETYIYEEEKRGGYPVAYLTLLRIISTGLTGWAEIDVIHVIFNSVHTSHSQHVTATLIYFSLSSWFSSSPTRVKNQKSHDDLLKENFLSWNQFIFLFFTHHINLLRLKKATRHVLTNLLPLGLAPSDL